MKRGKVVGVPTSGSVISTGPVVSWMLHNKNSFPWLVSDGYWAGHGIEWGDSHGGLSRELPAGKDKQLDKAIAILEREVERYNAVEEIELIKPRKMKL